MYGAVIGRTMSVDARFLVFISIKTNRYTMSPSQPPTGSTNVQAQLNTIFGQVSEPIWQAIATDPSAALGNSSAMFKRTVNGPPLPFTLWNTTWTDPNTLPVCGVYLQACVSSFSLGVGGLWQVVNMLDQSLVPVTEDYCFTDNSDNFTAYYAITQEQGQEFRSILGLPPECTTPNDPTCSVFFCTAQNTFIVLMVSARVCMCIQLHNTRIVFVAIHELFMLDAICCNPNIHTHNMCMYIRARCPTGSVHGPAVPVHRAVCLVLLQSPTPAAAAPIRPPPPSQRGAAAADEGEPGGDGGGHWHAAGAGVCWLRCVFTYAPFARAPFAHAVYNDVENFALLLAL